MSITNTCDTDGTIDFKCAILEAGRPGAVKCSTQCRHCEVTYNAPSTTNSRNIGDPVRCGVFTEPQPPTVKRSKILDYLWFWIGFVSMHLYKRRECK